MAFTPTTFVNVPPGQTPTLGTPKINATELNKLGAAVDDVDARLVTVETSLGGSGDITSALAAKANLALVAPFHVDSYGAVGDGSTSDTAAIQAAINAAAAAMVAAPFPSTFPKATATVHLGPKHYRASGLTLPGNVALVGNGTRITANTATPMITMSGFYNRVLGIYLLGMGVGAGAGDCGIVINTGSRWNSIDHLVFNNFAGRAVLDGGISNWARRLFAQNCLLDADALTDYTGVYEVTGTDSFVRDCEFTASRTTSMSASGKACALVIRGANTQAQNIIAEISDHGVYIAAGANQLHLSGVRGELCRGNGWIIAGGSGRISDPMALRNSQDGNNAGDGFTVTGVSNFTITNAWSESAASPARQRYGIYDPTVSASSYNRWISPVAIGNTLPFLTPNFSGAAFLFPDNPPATLPTATATPSVAGLKLFTAANVSAVTVTDFSLGVAGQPITIRGDGQTTVAHNATINNISGANQLLANGIWYRWVRYNGVWAQLP